MSQASSENFFSSGLRQKADALMDILYAGGVNNPATAIEQISYLLFLRLLSERDDTLAAIDQNYTRVFSGEWEQYAWGNFVTLSGDELFEEVRKAFEKLHELPSLSDTGRLLFNRATLKIYDRPALRAVVQGVHELQLDVDGHDHKGDLYEYLLNKLSASGTNGQFRTPRHIIDMIVAMVNPQPKERIADPACGTAGFLISAYRHILRQHTRDSDLKQGIEDGSQLKPAQWKHLEEHGFTGFDNDADMVKLGILNLYLHQLERANVAFFNPLTTSLQGGYPGVQYDVILANPPFSGSLQEEGILSDLNHGLNTKSTELLFLKWFIDHLAPNGRAGVIVPNGVLFGSSKAHKALRKMLLEKLNLHAIISLPSGVFKPYAGVATAVLVFEHTAPSESVWFYDLTADGFSLDDKRTPIDANDIPDLLAKWPNREEGPNSYRVTIDQIIENDSSLASGRYKPVEVEEIAHDHPADILREVIDLEHQIAQRAEALLNQTGKDQ